MKDIFIDNYQEYFAIKLLGKKLNTIEFNGSSTRDKSNDIYKYQGKIYRLHQSIGRKNEN